MKITTILLCLLSLSLAKAAISQTFSCPAGKADVMKYFVMGAGLRTSEFMAGNPNGIYTQVFPNRDFASAGYWFWLKTPQAHGFDVKAFDTNRIYMRSTEWIWKDNTTFKRFGHDLPIAARCVDEGQPGPEIKVADTAYTYYSACKPVKSSQLGTAVNDLDAPQQMNAGGNLGEVWTRVFHYHYNCDRNFKNCRDEEQFFLANGYGLWQWKHFRNEALVNSALMNVVSAGAPTASLPCSDSYQPRPTGASQPQPTD